MPFHPRAPPRCRMLFRNELRTAAGILRFLKASGIKSLPDGIFETSLGRLVSARNSLSQQRVDAVRPMMLKPIRTRDPGTDGPHLSTGCCGCSGKESCSILDRPSHGEIGKVWHSTNEPSSRYRRNCKCKSTSHGVDTGESRDDLSGLQPPDENKKRAKMPDSE